MSTPVTEAHLELAKTALFSRDKAGRLLTAPMAAQLIADSEARAVAKWQNSAHLKGEAIDSLLIECDRLRADLDAIKAIRDEEKARADEAEHDCRVLIGQLNDALAELDGIRALAGRNKRYCFKGTARELVAALDQALDIAQAELKAEQDIRVINEIELKVSRAIVSKIWTQLGSPTYEQLKGRSIYHLIDELKAELARERARMDYILRVCSAGVFYNATSRAAIDAAMKEGN